MIYVGIYNYSSVPYLQLFFLYNKLVSIILFTSSTCKMKLLFFFRGGGAVQKVGGGGGEVEAGGRDEWGGVGVFDKEYPS